MSVCENRGYALFVVVGTMATLAALSTTLLTMVHQSLQRQRQERQQDAALWLAEAGLQKAMVELSASGGAYAGEIDTPLGAGRFTVVVTPTKAEHVYRVISTGSLADGNYVLGEYTLTARAKIAPNGTVHLKNIRRGPPSDKAAQ